MRVLTIAMITGFLLAPAAHAAQTLLAPEYPGAVADQAAADERYAFLTHDPIEKVRSFYQAHRIKLVDGSDSLAPGYHLCARQVPFGTVNQCYSKVLLGQSGTAHYLKHVTEAYDAGLVIQAKARKPDSQPSQSSTGDPQLDRMMAAQAAAQAKLLAEANAEAAEVGFKPGELEAMNKMSALFEGLKQATFAPYNHSRAEAIALYKRYRHLETDEYPYVKAEGKDPVPYDQWLLARDKAAFSGPGDHWNQWIGFLKDLDAHAYRTRIVIPVDPRSWGDRR